MKKILLSLAVLTILVAFGATQAQADNPGTVNVTVTVTAGALSVALDTATWAAGSLVEGGTATTSTAIVATNDSTNLTETFSIAASGSANWSAAAAAGDEVFLMEAQGGDLASLTSIHASQTLKTGVAPAGTVSFDLKLTAPTSTDHGGVEQTIPVTVTAS